MRRALRLLLALPALGLLAGCHTDMWVQPKELSQQEADFFPDHSEVRPLVAHTIARGHLREDTPFFTGEQGGKWVDQLPMPVTEALLRRGQERFDIYCTPCHGRLGDGHGMVYERGFKPYVKVATYHTDRLRALPIGHFYDVITNGYGRMYSYASRIEPQDRWAIAAYIRVLQLSQHADAADYAAATKGAPPAAPAPPERPIRSFGEPQGSTPPLNKPGGTPSPIEPPTGGTR